jgi:hemoglobin
MAATLFERLGGFARVRLIVSEFYDRVLESPRLSPFFQHVEMRNLIDHQTRFMAAIMGGPASFTNEQITRAHRRLQISEEDFDELAELLRETLEDFDVDAADVVRVDAHVTSLRPYVVPSQSNVRAS